ncbi:MAG: DUF2281 domain-containing protein [Bacteroidota bacterium]
MATTLQEKIQQLSPELEREVERFIEFILQKEVLRKPAQKLKQDWGGALKEFRDQYTVAEKHNLRIVSFDTDFDKTERKRLTPQQVLQTLK